MPNFYLPKQHPQTLESLPNGRFYTKDNSNIVQVPHGCAPVWCPYNDDWVDDHSWTNPISGQVHEKNHPLGLMFIADKLFTDGFYEITEIKLTFGEGEAWDPDTNEKVRVEKIVPKSVWNPFFQRYDPQCDNYWHCKKVKKEVSSSSDCGKYRYFYMFTQCRHLFFDVYCKCGMRDDREHATESDSD